MKKILLPAMILLSALSAAAQRVEKQTFVYAVKGTDTLRLDRYAARPSAAEPKPCMLFVFGGGFVGGARDEETYVPYFDYYARRGYVVASIDYRPGMQQAVAKGALDAQTFPDLWLRTLSMAVEDLYDATGYILDRAASWGVDPARIVASGSSAGAITVLMGEYGICNASRLAQRLPEGFNYAGVISFAGAIFDATGELTWRRAPAPMLLFHGDADPNVPYGTLEYEGAGFFGSKTIADDLTARQIPHFFYSAADTDHSMATRPMWENRFEIDAFLEKLVEQRRLLIVDTYAKPLGAPELPKQFTLEDYVRANFGR